MNKELNIRIHYFLTITLAFLLPLYPRIIPVTIALLAINWAAGGNFIRLFQKNENRTFFLLFISLYILYVIGLIYTTNLQYGLKDLETKLSLLVFPLIYYSSDKFSKEKLRTILNFFLYGCVTACVCCLGNATYNYFHMKYLVANNIWAYNYGIDFFLKDRLSVWMHPSYRSMYFVLALAAVYLFGEKEARTSFWKKYLIPATLCVFILLFNSKAGILSLLLLGIYTAWHLVFKEKKIKLVLTGTAFALMAFFALYFSSTQFAHRIQGTLALTRGNIDVRNSEESSAIRIALWNAARIVIAENWLTGTGTGDVKDALLDQYRKEGMELALERNLNAHSQFLQTFAALGITGFLILCSSLLLPLFREWKKGHYVYVVFLLLILLNILIESMFETQAGVVFYAFFNSLLLFSSSENA